jgi:glyoxylase-like metal-dependent hydrolase (beta-lactamase superfamily II)
MMGPDDTAKQARGIQTVNVGQLECVVLSDGDRGNAHWGVLAADQAPETLEGFLAGRGVTSEFAVEVHPVAIRGGEETVLIDAGFGIFSGPDGVQRPGQVVPNLRAAGIEPEDIQLVVLTHPHGDHAGGLIRPDEGLTYPNARYVMPQAEWDFWMEGEPDLSGTLIDPAFRQGMKMQARTVLPEIKDRLELVMPDQEVFPGGRLLATPGHTPGLVGVEITSAGKRLLYLADAFMHPILSVAHPEWRVAMDADHATAVQTRQALLRRLADSGELVHNFHFAYPSVGRISREGDSYRWTKHVA